MTDPVDTYALRLYANTWAAEGHEVFGPNMMHAATDEVERLRAVIENAPHDVECNEGNVWRDGSTMPCTCWKADVL